MHSELQALSTLEELTARMRDLHTAKLGTATRASRTAPYRALADFLARLTNALDEIKCRRRSSSPHRRSRRLLVTP